MKTPTNTGPMPAGLIEHMATLGWTYEALGVRGHFGAWIDTWGVRGRRYQWTTHEFIPGAIVIWSRLDTLTNPAS